MSYKLIQEHFHFDGGWGAPDPMGKRLDEAMHKARYNFTALTQSEVYTILGAASAYRHFAGYCVSEGWANKSVAKQLVELRKATFECHKDDKEEETTQ
jgi:hypothetical protein